MTEEQRKLIKKYDEIIFDCNKVLEDEENPEIILLMKEEKEKAYAGKASIMMEEVANRFDINRILGDPKEPSRSRIKGDKLTLEMKKGWFKEIDLSKN